MKFSYRFENGDIVDLSNFKGEWTDQNIREQLGDEIADRIWQECPMRKWGEMLLEIIENTYVAESRHKINSISA
ncbi:MAG TPA: hypothetical protein VFJ23_00245 [Candidatus Nitrosotalea sp.]|nr:hypothetical protein [Candidatus Nitrosotalea sp.]